MKSCIMAPELISSAPGSNPNQYFFRGLTPPPGPPAAIFRLATLALQYHQWCLIIFINEQLLPPDYFLIAAAVSAINFTTVNY